MMTHTIVDAYDLVLALPGGVQAVLRMPRSLNVEQLASLRELLDLNLSLMAPALRAAAPQQEDR